EAGRAEQGHADVVAGRALPEDIHDAPAVDRARAARDSGSQSLLAGGDVLGQLRRRRVTPVRAHRAEVERRLECVLELLGRRVVAGAATRHRAAREYERGDQHEYRDEDAFHGDDWLTNTPAAKKERQSADQRHTRQSEGPPGYAIPR